MECKNHNLVFVKKKKINGTWLINKQCLSCGEKDSKAYSHKNHNIPAMPDCNEELFEMFWKSRNESEYKKHLEKRKSERTEWFEEVHNPYLNSDKWKSKRLKVLKRDNNLCQACLERPATEVHHLSYRHYKNEPLFDLTSLCNPCHVFITKIERNEETE